MHHAAVRKGRMPYGLLDTSRNKESMSILIVEGVTGAGKTSTIAALRPIADFKLFDEELTFDDFMTDFFVDPDAAALRAANRMAAILSQIEADPSQKYLLERLHFSQLALGSDWKWYREIDSRCGRLGCRVVLLSLPNGELGSRSLYRSEYGGKDWQDFIQRYGSEARSLDAIRLSRNTDRGGPAKLLRVSCH